jgi:uncharacterized membrane protein
MSLIAVALVILSAVLHATWNFRSKNTGPSPAFFLVATTTVAVFTLPILLYYRHDIATISSDVWALLALAGFFQASFFWSLAKAYAGGDLSLIYPLARSSPVPVVAFVSLVLGRGDQVSTQVHPRYWSRRFRLFPAAPR